MQWAMPIYLFASGLGTGLPMVEIRQVVKTNSKTCFHTASIIPDSGLFFGRTTAKDIKISCCWLADLIYLHIHNSAPPLVANSPQGKLTCFLIAGRENCECYFLSKLKPDGGGFVHSLAYSFL